MLPAVNQLELHPVFPQTELLQWHRDRGIIVEAWSPLGRGELLTHPTLVKTAAQEGLSPGELILAWHAARGTIPLPRSSSRERQATNLAAVDKQISKEAITAVTSLGEGGGRLWNQDPAEYEEF